MYKHTVSAALCAVLVTSLEANTLSTDPIAITAVKTEQSLKNTTSNIQIITADELEEKHITTLIDALKSLANVPIIQSGGVGQQSSLFFHGFKQGSTLVLIDGIRYNDPTTTEGQAQLEHLMIADIERIELLNGAQSGVWGSNASAGVINVITKKPTHRLELSANAEYGSFATSKLGMSASQKIDQFGYYIGASQLKSEGFSSATPKGEDPESYEKDAYLNQTLNAKLFYDIADHDSLKTQFNFIDAKTEYDPYDTPNGSGREVSQINRLGNVVYQHRFNETDKVELTYAITQFNKNDPLGYTPVFKGKNTETSIQGEYSYNQDDRILIGLNTLHAKDTISAKELDSEGIFLTNTNHVGNLIFTQSLRYDDYDLFNDKTTGKLGAKYFFTPDIALSGNYGTAYRVPSLYELYADYYGNAALRPETTKSFDITLSYHTLSLTHYHNKIDDLIGYNSSTYVNEQAQGTSTIKGYELRYDEQFESIGVDVAYTKLSAKNQEGKYLNRRPKELIQGSLDYTPYSALSIGVSGNYIGTRYDDLAQTKQTGRYTLWSAFVNYNLNPTCKLYLKGENMTDKRYQEADGYGTAGRSLYAGLTTQF